MLTPDSETRTVLTPVSGTRNGNNAAGLSQAAKDVADHAKYAIAKLVARARGARAEAGRSPRSQPGSAWVPGAVIFAFFGLFAFLLATAAAPALTLVMSPWLALLIMFAVVTARSPPRSGFLAVGAIKKGTPPVPEQAIPRGEADHGRVEALMPDGERDGR